MHQSGYQSTLAWYQAHATEYAEKSHTYSTIDLSQLDEFVAYLPPGAKILDAGCGAGRDTQRFAERGFLASGVDITTELLKTARKQYPTADFQIGDLLSLPFADSSFDGVWAHASLVHFETMEQIQTAVAELYRVLRTPGMAHILVRATTGHKTELKQDAFSAAGRFYWNFDEQELRTVLTQVGFRLMKMTRYKESDLDPSKRPDDAIEWWLVLAEK